MNFRSLTFSLVAWYCGLLLLVGGSFAGYTYLGFSWYLRDLMRDTLAVRSHDAAVLARPLLDDPEALKSVITSRFAPESHDRFMRISLDGRQVYLSGEPAEHAFDPKLIAAEPRSDGALLNIGTLWVYTHAERLPDGRWLSIDTGQLDSLPGAARHGLALMLLSALPLLLLVAAYGGYRLVGFALKPMAAMIKAAEALTFNSPSKRLPTAGHGDVIDELGQTLNRMLERLDGAYQHATRFSSDAAHELRTPLAIIRGEIEFITGRADLDPQILAATENAINENIRLSQIVENLLTMSLIDSVGGKRSHIPVELHELAVETIEQMRLMAEEKRIVLSCADGTAVVAIGDRGRLKQVLVNLIDNAIKYTPAGGWVRVTVQNAEGGAVLAVGDSGIGIAPEHRSQVFERFFRVNPDRGTAGAGLGLAIVRSICTAHGGSVDIESSPGMGCTFRVRLPLAPASRP